MAVPTVVRTATGANTGTSLTFAVDCTGGDYIVVGVHLFDTTETVSTVTVDGNSCTQESVGYRSANGARAELWLVASPGSGSKNVVITPSGSTTIIGAAHVISGTSGTVNVTDNAEAASTSVSLSLVTTAADCLILDAVTTGTPDTDIDVTDAGQTHLYEDNDQNPVSGGASMDAASTGTYTPGWDFISNRGWGMAGLALEPSAGGGGSTVSRTLSDSFSPSDSITTTGQFTRNVTDSNPISDVIATDGHFIRELADSFSPSDALTHAKRLRRVLTDSFTFSDAIDRSQSYFVRVLSEFNPLSDSLDITTTGTLGSTGDFFWRYFRWRELRRIKRGRDDPDNKY